MKTALSKLELSVWLHTFGRSLVAIFIPILLLHIGFSLSQVILFYVVFNLIDVPFNFLARRLVIRRGAKEVILFGILFEIIGMVILTLNNFSFGLLFALAFVLAGYDTFYWVAHWFVFNECIKKNKKIGGKVGGLMIVRKIASLIAPLIGAGFLIFLSRRYLLAVSILFLFLSLIPLFRLNLKYVVPRERLGFKEFFKYKQNRNDFFYAFLSHFSAVAEGVLLPLFVFVTFESIKSIGVLSFVASISSIVLIFYTGKLTDKINSNSLIFIGAVFVGLFWLLRILFPSVNLIYITSLLIGFFTVLVSVPIDANIVMNGKKTSMIDVSCYRNFFHMFGELVFFVVLYLVVDIFKVSFIIAAMTMFVMAFISAVLLRVRKNS